MSDFVLVHGAWHRAAVWAPVIAALEARGHRAIAPDLPSESVSAGAVQYAEAVAEAAKHADRPTVVGHTLAGLTLPLLPSRMEVSRLVYVNALLPDIGRSLAEQLTADSPALNDDIGRNYDREARSFWPEEDAFRRLLAHDCSELQAATVFAQMRPQARRPIKEVTPLLEWPGVPSAAILYCDDVDLSPGWLWGVARERLGVEPVELRGSQLGFVADPEGFVDALEALG